MNDQRIAELEELAREEGIELPLPAHMIVAYERSGYIVDLCSGMIYKSVTVAPSAHAKAVSYLLSAAN